MSHRLRRAVAVHCVLFALTAAVALPLFMALKSSFVSNDAVLSTSLLSVPKNLTLTNYSNGYHAQPFGRYFLNSGFVALTVTVATVFTSAAAGYGFSKFTFPGRDLLFTLTVIAMLVPFQGIVIPLFLEMKQLHWINSFYGLIVPTAVGGFGVFMVRQFMQHLPDSLLEAARVDGCSEVRVFRSIVIPIAKGPLAALAAITFMASWNNFLWPLLISQSDNVTTVPIGLLRFRGTYQTNYGEIFAMSILSALPVIVLFVVMRRRIMSSFATSGITG